MFEVRLSDMPGLARAMHAACGAVVQGMDDDQLYLPRGTGFGLFRDCALTELPEDVGKVFERDGQGAYVGLALDWVTSYCGWMPFQGARVEIRLDGHNLALTIVFDRGVVPRPADERRFAQLVEICAAAGAVGYNVSGELPEAVKAALKPVPLVPAGVR